jgi:hypothetical protein
MKIARALGSSDRNLTQIHLRKGDLLAQGSPDAFEDALGLRLCLLQGLVLLSGSFSLHEGKDGP